MARNDDVRLTSRFLNLPTFHHHHHAPPSPFSNLLSNSFGKMPNFINFKFNHKISMAKFFNNFPKLPKFQKIFHFHPPPKSSLLRLASISISQNNGGAGNPETDSTGSAQSSAVAVKSSSRDEERVLISEVLVKNKDGEELERKDLEAEALNALKASRANAALTVREVQEDVHRIIASGYFASCMPVAHDTRDGIRLVFQVVYLCWLTCIYFWFMCRYWEHINFNRLKN